MDNSQLAQLIEDQGTMMKAWGDKLDEQAKEYDGLNLDVIKRLESSVLDLQEAKQTTDRILAAKGNKDQDPDESETKGLFAEYMRRGDRMSPEDQAKFDAFQQKSLSVNLDPDGGFQVTPEVTTKVITRQFETSPMRSIASVISISTDSLDVMIDDDEPASGGWTAEKASVVETDTPEFGRKNIPTHEQFAKPKATQKILDDSAINIENWLAGKISRKMTRFENTAFISGDGAGKPTGILALPDWAVPSVDGTEGVYERGALETINSGTDGVIDPDTLILLQSSLIEDYDPNSVWLANKNTVGALRQLKNGFSDYRLLDLNTGGNMMLLGKPILFSKDMPTIASAATVLLYGDFGIGYQIVDRLGIRVLRDPFSSKPFVEFYTTKRVGGDVINFEAIKRYRLSI